MRLISFALPQCIAIQNRVTINENADKFNAMFRA